MDMTHPIFLAAKPGLEPVLAQEAKSLGFVQTRCVPGGVECAGGWAEVMKANFMLRGAERVLWRIAQFRAMHPAQLDKRARKVDWANWLPRGAAVAVEATCRKSRIYHQGAARSRVAGAIEDAGAKIADKAGLKVMVRIEDDLCTISLDTSGGPLHQRGHKQFVGKAPMRETMASLFLKDLGFDGSQTLIDPMCGSGTFVIEAAEISAGLMPGRSRNFAFERFVGCDHRAWEEMKSGTTLFQSRTLAFGCDRDQGAIAGAIENAKRAGVEDATQFYCSPISDLQPPSETKGIVVANPPYGARIGNPKLLYGLYGSFGQVLKDRFAGWKIGIVTSDDRLARATGLDLVPGPHVAHGGLKVRLWKADI